MCGIVGYIGNSDSYPVLVKGLHRLEYRGYDSAGIAFFDTASQVRLVKQVGKVAALKETCEKLQGSRQYRNSAYTMGYAWRAE